MTRSPSLFDVPEIRTPVPVAPGSRSSEDAAKSITDPMRARSHRLIMLALQSASRPLSREELSARTGIKESTLCARLSELRIEPAWVEAVDRGCVSSSGRSVDGYRIAKRREAAA